MNAKEIIARIAAQHEVTVEELKGAGTKRQISDARCHCYYDLIEYGLSTTQIAIMFDRDHSTVVTQSKKWPEIFMKKYDRLFGNVANDRQGQPVNVVKILHTVANDTGVSPAEIVGISRRPKPQQARSEFYQNLERAGMSQKAISKLMGRTVNSSLQRRRKERGDVAVIRVGLREDLEKRSDTLLRLIANDLRQIARRAA